jgi:hypothetical protein
LTTISATPFTAENTITVYLITKEGTRKQIYGKRAKNFRIFRLFFRKRAEMEEEGSKKAQ